MRKSLFVVGIIALIVAGALLQAGENEQELADFEIVVTVTPDGVTMKSHHGCAWVETAYSDPGDTYTFTVDEYGVGGAGAR